MTTWTRIVTALALVVAMFSSIVPNTYAQQEHVVTVDIVGADSVPADGVFNFTVVLKNHTGGIVNFTLWTYTGITVADQRLVTDYWPVNQPNSLVFSPSGPNAVISGVECHTAYSICRMGWSWAMGPHEEKQMHIYGIASSTDFVVVNGEEMQMYVATQARLYLHKDKVFEMDHTRLMAITP